MKDYVPSKTTEHTTATDRKPWIAPQVQKMRAEDAEAGPNPLSPEGAFAFGS